MRLRLVEHFLEVEDRRVGVESGAVVELHAFAQLEHPLGLVFGVHRPALGETGDDHAGFLGRREIPHGERIEQREPGEAIAFEAAVGLAGGRGNVGCGHADARGRLGAGRRSSQQQRGCQREHGAFQQERTVHKNLLGLVGRGTNPDADSRNTRTRTDGSLVVVRISQGKHKASAVPRNNRRKSRLHCGVVHRLGAVLDSMHRKRTRIPDVQSPMGENKPPLPAG